MTFIAMTAVALTCVMLSSPAAAQRVAPFATWFEWPDLHVAMLSDSSGTYVWAQPLATPGPGPKPFIGVSLDPRSIENWIPGARELATRSLTQSDTGTDRRSEFLSGTGREGVYLIRRRVNGSWLNDPVLSFGTRGDTAPLLVHTSLSRIVELLDSLKVVARATPFSAAVSQRLIAESSGQRLDKEARFYPGSRLPRHPWRPGERSVDGLAIVSFVVNADGRADMETVRPFLVTHDMFLVAVKDALPYMQFHPAMRSGQTVASRVTVPFQFSLR